MSGPAPRVLKPSRRITAFRGALALPAAALGAGAVASGGVVLGVVMLAAAAWLVFVTARILVGTAYELHLDDTGFRVLGLMGRPVHEVPWRELAGLDATTINGHAFVVVAFVCEPRRPKRGVVRWRRGTRHDDGCFPDTYGMRADELMFLMDDYARAADHPVFAPERAGVA